MRLIVTKDYEELSKKAANILFSQITLKPNCVLGLATGSTPVGTYENLIARYQAEELSFEKVKTVNLDEYVGLSGEDAQSYRYFMNQNLFNHVDIDKKNTYVPDGKSADRAFECAEYEKTIQKLGGIDMQLLGIGNNGHIGFNEPNTCFDGETHEVQLTESTIQANRRFFESEDDVPRFAISMGIKTIMGAKKILLLASGKAKAQIIFETCFGPITPQVPASALQLHPDVTIVADEEAYGVIRNREK